MAKTELQRELNALKSDISQLREDVGNLTGTFKGVASEKITGARGKLKNGVHEGREALREKLNQARERGGEAVDSVEEQIGQHPLGSLAAAFSVGFLAAKILDRNSRG